jgi:hypothetical protein
MWLAHNSPGEPLCICGTKNGTARDDGYSVALYFGKGGKIKGVEVFDGESEGIVVVTFGKVPDA